MANLLMLLVLVLAAVVSTRRQFKSSVEEMKREHEYTQRKQVSEVTSSVHVYDKDEIERIFGRVQYIEKPKKQRLPAYAHLMEEKPKFYNEASFYDWVQNCRDVDKAMRPVRMRSVS